MFATLAQSLLPEDQPAAFNQAIMDFGAIQCTPQSPRCLVCPLQETCAALREGRVETLPVKLKTMKVKTRRLAYVYIWCNGETAIRRRPTGVIWAGLWEVATLPSAFLAEEGSGELSTVGQVFPASGETKKGFSLICKDVKHVLTHRILLADFYLWEVETKPQLSSEYIWINESDLDDYAKPRLIEKLIESLPHPL